MPAIVPSKSHAFSFSALLERLGEGDEPRLTVREMVEAAGNRAFGAVMLIVSLLNMLPLPPGGTTILGLPLLFLSFQLAVGAHRVWLPTGMMAASVSRRNFADGVRKFMPMIRMVEGLSRPRMTWLVAPVFQRLIGVVCLVVSFVLILPIPLGNFAPAVTMGLFSLAIMQRDGYALILAFLGVAVSGALLILAWKIVAGFVALIGARVESLSEAWVFFWEPGFVFPDWWPFR